MNTRWYRLCGAAIIVVVVALVGWSLVTGDTVAAIHDMLGGVVLLYLLKRLVGDAMEDERDYRVSEKASRFSIRVFVLATAIAGVALTVTSTSESPPFRTVGLTLAFCACGLLILYLASYAYHDRRS